MMPTLTRYDLDPGGPFHLGRRGVELEETGIFISADTLFAAFVAAHYEFGLDPNALPRLFSAATESTAAPAVPFLLSSAFPRAGRVCFFPALPVNRLNLNKATARARHKELRSVAFVSQHIFEKAVAGEALDDWLPPVEPDGPETKGVYLQGKSLWLARAEVDQLSPSLLGQKDRKRKCDRVDPIKALPHQTVWQVEKVPRVTVDRLTNQSNIFHAGRLHFEQGCGFWFGIEWRQPDQPLDDMYTVRAGVELALDSLADIGLGGERSAGYGCFQWKATAMLTLPEPQPDRPYVTLSRYHPRAGELPACLRDTPVAYSLMSVGGWLQSPQSKAQRRRRLWMIEEGSIVRAVGPGPWGDITDVKPDYSNPDFPPPADDNPITHPVWRYGLACPVAFGGR
ncbi:MAG: type III-A CRISPR-associated RAMP protein Csm4 [Anaerolineae bacterium]|nr:type III-A CRISPR-associated RAMP protein Csm4 [Anaerolineae bacterium]